MTVVLDADGVLLNFNVAFFRYLNENKGFNIQDISCRDYNFRDILPDLVRDELLSLIRNFAAHDSFQYIPPIQGVTEALETLQTTLKDDFVVVTAIGFDTDIVNKRIKNLRSIGFLGDVITTDPSLNKREALARFPQNSIFIDDLSKNVIDGENALLNSYLFAQDYNANDHDKHDVLTDWKHATHTILSHYSLSQPITP